MFDIPPPETDEDAIRLSKKIREWISNGRPRPKEELKEDEEEDLETTKEQKQDKQEEKTKKKRGLFGFFRK